MSPRRYNLDGKRGESLAATRARILEATLRLHGQKGILGTSWKDIAAAADVAVGTVYKHFPTLDELVPACGALMMERFAPPAPDMIGPLLDGVAGAEARLLRVGQVLFAFYERAGVHLESDPRERQLPMVAEWEAYLRDLVGDFVKAALAGADFGPGRSAEVCFLFDYPVYFALRRRGLTPEAATRIAAGMALGWLAPGCGRGAGPVG